MGQLLEAGANPASFLSLSGEGAYPSAYDGAN